MFGVVTAMIISNGASSDSVAVGKMRTCLSFFCLTNANRFRFSNTDPRLLSNANYFVPASQLSITVQGLGLFTPQDTISDLWLSNGTGIAEIVDTNTIQVTLNEPLPSSGYLRYKITNNNNNLTHTLFLKKN